VTVLRRVLIANRGEVAVRIARTVRALGATSIAVYSDADVDARHVHEADVAVRIGPVPAADSYLSIERVVEAARATGADAVHPGYGFLSENPALATACAEADITFVGPPASAIAAMGDKVRAKALVAAAGVPVVPGSEGRGLGDDELAAVAATIGFPVLLKPSAGGGGKGMRVVEDPTAFSDAVAGARREARGAFGDDTLLLERFVNRPRHIEIQVLADQHGHVVHLGERECSLQRRHQKVVEESPSPSLSEPTREAMGAAAVDAARACGYVGAGTVEFIVPSARPDEFFFLEMNTRLQVEHPVTELVHGLDLVELQLRVAAGEALPFAQDALVARGHAIEARVYAEDPAAGFLPTGGTVLVVDEPDDRPGVRVDSSLDVGAHIGTEYDPMLAKVIAHGADRAEALRRLDTALAHTTVLGVTTNIGFLRRLLADDDVVAGRLDTGLVDRRLPALVAGSVPDEVVVAAALRRLTPDEPVTDPWHLRRGWSPAGTRPQEALVEVRGHEPVTVVACWRDGSWWVRVGDDPTVPERPAALSPAAGAGASGSTEVVLVLDGRRTRLSVADGPNGEVWFGWGGEAWASRIEEPWQVHRGDRASAGSGPVPAPMPGTLTAVLVAEGDAVHEGQPLAVVEAMKMEFTLRAPQAGIVAVVHGPVGRQVALGEPIVTVADADDAAAHTGTVSDADLTGPGPTGPSGT
jgi:acetyl-CoA/propionyl-CoA carboxylase biotin carboxyl carrier protein